MGPTASGKTALAMRLREALPVDIISVDSALVYRGLDIGSAKPTLEEQKTHPHRLIDIRNPTENYSAAEFCQDALAEIKDIHSKNRIPLLVGGTMLYFKALLEGLADLPNAHPDIRREIEAKAKTLGWPSIHAELEKVDAVAAARIHPHHSQRLCRALEVFLATGKTLTQHQKEQADQGKLGILEDYAVAQIAITPTDRSYLHQRIAKRFELMMAQGFLDEMKTLFQRSDLHGELPAMRSVGYRQLWEYLEHRQTDLEHRQTGESVPNENDLNSAIEKGIVASRQLAKRQLTWLRGWNYPLHWVHTKADVELEPASNLGRKKKLALETLPKGHILTNEHKIITETLNYLGEQAI